MVRGSDPRTPGGAGRADDQELTLNLYLTVTARSLTLGVPTESRCPSDGDARCDQTRTAERLRIKHIIHIGLVSLSAFSGCVEVR